MTSRHRITVLVLVGALYLGALLLPVVPTHGGSANGGAMFNDGFWLLLSGRIFHPATLLTIITWLAHPFIWVGLGFIATGQSRRAALCGGMALVCTVCLLPLYQLHTIRFAGFWLLLGAAWALWYLHALHRDLLSAPATNSWQSIENSWKMTGQGLSKYDGR